MPDDGPYESIQSVDLNVNCDISVGEDGLLLGECVFRQSYFFLCNSGSHVASGIILVFVKSRYLKVPTCFILSP